jgi:hypothetical protein
MARIEAGFKPLIDLSVLTASVIDLVKVEAL